jgi:hypothetical protein
MDEQVDIHEMLSERIRELKEIISTQLSGDLWLTKATLELNQRIFWLRYGVMI